MPSNPVLSALSDKAVRLHDAGKYSEAVRIAEMTVRLAEQHYGPDHLDVSLALNLLATLCRGQGRHAKSLIKRCIAIVEKKFGPHHPVVGVALIGLAARYRSQGRDAEAEPLLKRCITIVEKELGPDHPFVGSALDHLATLYQSQGRHAEAEPLLKRADTLPGLKEADVRILFATNRRPEPITAWTSFSATQETDIAKISFGTAIVRAPIAEVLNKSERFADALGQRDRVVGRQTSVTQLAVRAVELDARGARLAAVARDRLTRAARFPGQAFVFVHGYNTSFEDAVRRTAMIAFDLDFDGVPFLFTWPSHAKLAAYRSDRKRARVAAPFLVELLDKIAAQLPDVKVHVLAHSTGGEIALSALAELAERFGSTRPRLGELILAHVDVDPARLGRVMPSLRKLGMGVTSYSSAIDWAMRISRAVRLITRSRVGARPVHIDGVDAIDITGLSGGPLALNHTVFVDNPMVFGDMNRLMATGERPPDSRTAFFVPVKSRRGTHWEYKSMAAT